jgi:hypothetical protein
LFQAFLPVISTTINKRHSTLARTNLFQAFLSMECLLLKS